MYNLLMRLSSEQVKKVAKLAKLPLSQEKEELYSEQLSKILDYIDHLNTVETKDVEPTYNVSGKKNVMAEDEVEPSLSQDEALKNSPNHKNGFFVTKGVFDNE
jgi:aspartyl-tRNA(Asn)/glutamyl-tRNA(Gln) amidotransferase subunit C